MVLVGGYEPGERYEIVVERLPGGEQGEQTVTGTFRGVVHVEPTGEGNEWDEILFFQLDEPVGGQTDVGVKRESIIRSRGTS